MAMRLILTTADVERFWAKVDRSGGPDVCWPWTASLNKSGGYGKFGLVQDGRKVTVAASRVALTVKVGPTEHWALHTCDNPPCCNPAHLYAGERQGHGGPRTQTPGRLLGWPRADAGEHEARHRRQGQGLSTLS